MAFLRKKMEAADPGTAAPLYVRLGGEPAVKAVVKDFVQNVAADARVNAFFKNTDIPNLEKLLFEQICAATGGGCTYSGRDMKTTDRVTAPAQKVTSLAINMAGRSPRFPLRRIPPTGRRACLPGV